VLSRRASARIRHNVLGGQPLPEGATAFLDRAPLAAADPTFDAIDFWPGLLNACHAGEVQVGIPLQVSASLILFDKAASDAAGVAYLEPGGLGEEFRHAAEMLTVGYNCFIWIGWAGAYAYNAALLERRIGG
jgi:ABC-type glycerol-3-phosphate transport system substrate-binding protein